MSARSRGASPGGRRPDEPSRAPLAAAAALAALAGAGCFERGYPLGSDGSVDVRLDVAGPLFAADVLDASGKGALPRQSPFQTGVTLTLTEGAEAANGGFVDVRVEPSEALSLSPDDDGADGSPPTCQAKDGKFRCTASPEGIARFVLTSEASWSGEADLVVTWADDRKETQVTVLPAGLPPSAKNFAVIATGLSDSERVQATYSALSCTTFETLPDDLGSKWREGHIRSRQAFVRATAPADQPGVVEAAPVVIESLSSEAYVSLDASCGKDHRVTKLRLQLGATGESPPFHFCFSDIGGVTPFSVTSGVLTVAPNPTFDVDPEPRVLRVEALTSTVVEGQILEIVEVSAFNTDLERIAMDVDVESSNPFALQLLSASETLAPEGTDPSSVVATAIAPGTATIHVRPRLFKKPDCTSTPFTVTAAPPSEL